MLVLFGDCLFPLSHILLGLGRWGSKVGRARYVFHGSLLRGKRRGCFSYHAGKKNRFRRREKEKDAGLPSHPTMYMVGGREEERGALVEAHLSLEYRAEEKKGRKKICWFSSAHPWDKET